MKHNQTIGILYIISIFITIGALSQYLQPILVTRNNTIQYDEMNQASVRKSRKNTKITTTVTPKNELSFIENFENKYTTKESGSINESSDTKWWLGSGAYLHSLNSLGSTIQGELSTIDPWRVAYYISNPVDTDNGYHPQNIFRLVQKNIWSNFRQESYFKITKNNLSESPNRNSSNGLLLFNRYKDQNNLYYTGIRVDGYAIIKKKINGTYYTMDYKPVFTSNPYDKSTNPNLIPSDLWIGIRSEVITKSDNTVNIKVYMDKGKTGNWVLIAEANDNGKDFGGSPIIKEGYAGIRTDFMDVLFDDYKINAI